MKIRSSGDLPSKLIEAYGASPVFMGGGEVYMALQRNTVDGATSGNDGDVAKNTMNFKVLDNQRLWILAEFIVAMNKDFYGNLPANTQQF